MEMYECTIHSKCVHTVLEIGSCMKSVKYLLVMVVLEVNSDAIAFRVLNCDCVYFS